MDRMKASNVAAHVIREAGDGERQRGMARLRSMLASVGLTRAQASVDHGDPCRLTLEKQRETAAELIVLGKDGPSALCNFLLGGVPQHVLSGAACDVLAMPKVAFRDRASLSVRGTWLDSGSRKAFEPADMLAPTAL